MLSKILLFSSQFILFTGLWQSTFSQTNSFKLTWDKNLEEDMSLYQVFRSTGPMASTKIADVQHPDTTYTDTDIATGVQYFYRLKAVDFSFNPSNYSEEVSVAVPKISGLPSQQILASETTIIMGLDSLVFDPDDLDDQLSWTISGANMLVVTVTNRVASITTPTDWTGDETLTFKVTDDGGFFDSKDFIVKSSAGNSSSAPEFLTVPDQALDEDTQTNLKLSDYVTDLDSNIEDLTFSYGEINSVTLSLNKDTLTIKPAENWFGTRTVNVTVTDEGGLSDQTTFNVTVNAVNDAPIILALPVQTLNQNGSTVLNLSPYVSDVDDNNNDLEWAFSNESKTVLSFNSGTGELTITALTDSIGFDYVQVSVTDPSGDIGEATLIVRILGSTSVPQIGILPQIQFNEDESGQLALNNYVTDDDDPVQNLFWHNGTGGNVAVQIDHTTNTATFIPDENWYGSEDVWLFVTDPDQNMDSAQVMVTVVPVNDRPQLSDLPAMNLSEQLSRQLNIKNYTVDVDDDLGDLKWTASSTPNVTVQIDGDGVATFTVLDSWLGQEKIQVIVEDKASAKDTSDVLVFRQDQANAPSIFGLNSVIFAEDTQYIIHLEDHASDADNTIDELTWSYSNNDHMDIIIDIAANEMTLVPNADWFGTEAIYLELTDPNNNVDFDTMLVTVTAVNDPPQLNTIGRISIIENSVHTIDLDQIIFDADGLDDIVDITVLNQGNSFIGVFLDLAYYQLTFFAPGGFYGSELFILKVQDSFGEQAEIGFAVDVLRQTVDGNIQVLFFGSNTNKNISYNTLNETKDYIQYGLTTAYGDTTQKEQSFKLSHSHILSGLQENSTYYFRVVSESTNGTISYSSSSEFSTSSGKEINVFPIPYRASMDINGNGISFTNLPLNSELKIFNLLGEPVFTKNVLSSYFSWKVENNAGKKISSGLYIYIVKSEKNKKSQSSDNIINY